MKVWWWVIGAVAAVVVVSVGLAAAMPGEAIMPEGPTASPTPSMTTENWLNPAFPWRTGLTVLAAVATMATIALVARAIDRRRGR